MTSKSKPVGGFPSIKKAVEVLLEQGMSRDDIVAKLGITEKQFYNACKFETHVVIPNDLIEDLMPFAKARNVPINTFIRYLITSIVENNMVDNILDDDNKCEKSKKARNDYIKEHYRKGKKAKDIAKMYNISIGWISRISRMMNQLENKNDSTSKNTTS